MTQIEGFQIIRRLGRGGMGEVFEAVRTGPGGFRRAVALKRLSGDAAVRGAAVQRFLAEARILASLHHPNVIEVYDVVEADTGYVLVMELLRGATLDALARATALPVAELCAIADQALAGLTYVHTHDLVHRDLTPNNVFITDAGEVKLIDFGIAKLRAAGDVPLTRDGELHGTLELIAPEQARGEPPDPRTDVYQLAASLYWAATGRYPHGSGTHLELIARAANQRPTALAELRRDLPPSFTAAIDRAMSIDRAARFPSAADMRTALAALAPTDGAARLAARVRTLAPPDRPDGLDGSVATATTRDERPPDGARRDTASAPADARPDNAAPRNDARLDNAAPQPDTASPRSDKSSAPDNARPDKRPARRRVWPFAVAGAAVAIGGGAWLAMHRDAPITTSAPEPAQRGLAAVPGVVGAVSAVPLSNRRVAVATPSGVTVVAEAGGDRRELAIPPGSVPVDVEAIANDRVAITVQSPDGDYRTFVEGDPMHSLLFHSERATTATHPDGVRIARANLGYAVGLEGRAGEPSTLVPVALGNEIAVVLAWSPDGTRFAAIRDRGRGDPTIDIVEVASHATRTLTHRPFGGDIGLFGWLDAATLVYAVDRPDGAVLYRFAIATQAETELARLPGERVLGGHVAAGAIAIVHGTPASSLLLGTAGSLHAMPSDASTLAGFDRDGRLVLGRATAPPTAQAADGTTTPWPGGEPGDRANTLVGDTLLAVRGGDLYQVGPNVRRLTTAPAARTVVRCAGDIALPCIIVDPSDRTERYRLFDLESATAGDWITERRARDHAVSADGAALAVVDPSASVRVYDIAARKTSWRKVDGGATLEAVAWSGSDVIVAARGYRQHAWSLLAIDAANQVRLLAEAPNRVAAQIRTSGDQIAVLATDVTPVVSVLHF